MAITRAQIARQLYRFGGDTMGGPNDKSVGGPGPDDRGTAQQNRNQRAQVRAGNVRTIENLIDRPTIGFTDAAKVNITPLGLRALFNTFTGPDFKNQKDFGGRDEMNLYRQMMAQQAGTMDNVPEEEDDEEEKKLEGLRLAFRAEGGSMNDQIRQAYGIGDIVKKAVRGVKKVAKSPVGKAALLYGAGSLGLKGIGQYKAGTGIFSPTGFLKSKALPFLVGKAPQFMGPVSKGYMTPGSSGILGAGGKLNPFKAFTVASLLPLLGIGTGEETEQEAQAILDQSGLDVNAIREAYLGEDQYRARAFKAEGGSMDEPVAKKTMPLLDMDGQEMDLRAEGGFVPIGRMEKADDVPARLSKNEFVFTAEAVRNAGEGDVDKGAEVMYNMMKNLEAGGDVSEESQGLEGARRMFQTSQRLEEVL